MLTKLDPAIFLLLGLCVVVFQLATASLTVFYMRRRYRRLEQLKRRHGDSRAALMGLEQHLSQMRTLERFHWLSEQGSLTLEVEHRMQSLWVAIRTAVDACLEAMPKDGSRFPMLSVQGGFDVYWEMQQRFLAHSNAGDKGLAEHLLLTHGQEVGHSLEHLLKTTQTLHARFALAELAGDYAAPFAWLAYPTMALVLSAAAFLGLYAFYA